MLLRTTPTTPRGPDCMRAGRDAGPATARQATAPRSTGPATPQGLRAGRGTHQPAGNLNTKPVYGARPHSRGIAGALPASQPLCREADQPGRSAPYGPAALRPYVVVCLPSRSRGRGDAGHGQVGQRLASAQPATALPLKRIGTNRTISGRGGLMAYTHTRAQGRDRTSRSKTDRRATALATATAKPGGGAG